MQFHLLEYKCFASIHKGWQKMFNTVDRFCLHVVTFLLRVATNLTALDRYDLV